jgi:hypothetical protein
VKERSAVISRTARESKAELTHFEAMKIVATEKAQQQSKTARLRKLRLARDKSDKPREAK